MKRVLIYRPSCKGFSPKSEKCFFQVNFDAADVDANLPPRNTIKPSSELFDEIDLSLYKPEPKAEINITIAKTLLQKFEKHKDDPTEYCARKVYDLVRSNLQVEIPRSKYTDEIELIERTISTIQQVTFEKAGQKYYGWCFEVPDTPDTPMILVFNFYQSSGCDCFNTATPLAIFDNDAEADNFLKKCANVYHSKHMQEVYDSDSDGHCSEYKTQVYKIALST
jgi:hypothetical protein